jgi:hypothetical protein
MRHLYIRPDAPNYTPRSRMNTRVKQAKTSGYPLRSETHDAVTNVCTARLLGRAHLPRILPTLLSRRCQMRRVFHYESSYEGCQADDRKQPHGLQRQHKRQINT